MADRKDLEDRIHREKEKRFDRILHEMYPDGPTPDDIKRKLDKRIVDLLLEMGEEGPK